MAQIAIPLAVIASAGSAVAKLSAQEEAEQAQLQAIKLKSTENDITYNQKKISNLDNIDKVIQRQEAQATTRGIALTSPSFNAIQTDTFNIGAKQLTNLDTEKSLYDANTDIEKQNVQDSFQAEVFGDIFDTGMNFAKLKGL